MKKQKETSVKFDVLIKWTNNGAYVIYNPHDGPTDAVYKFDEEDLHGLQELLNDLKDMMAPGCKWDKHRVFAELVHGRDYECHDDKCEICEWERIENEYKDKTKEN